MVNADSPLGLQHVVGLRLGTPVDLSSSLPASDLDRALCVNSVTPCLIRKRKAYWAEINPILEKWQSVNDTKCPECDQVVPRNMAQHLRLEHAFCQCVWRCPVANCPSWFTSESALHNLELVLNRIAEYGLQLKSTKCNLFRTSVPFLGHIVGRAGLECDPNKLSAVAN